MVVVASAVLTWPDVDSIAADVSTVLMMVVAWCGVVVLASGDVAGVDVTMFVVDLTSVVLSDVCCSVIGNLIKSLHILYHPVM